MAEEKKWPDPRKIYRVGSGKGDRWKVIKPSSESPHRRLGLRKK
jgi:hypothetical protein